MNRWVSKLYKEKKMPRKIIKMIALYNAWPGQKEALKNFLNTTISEALKSSGCLAFELQQNVSEKYHFNFIEEWDGQVTYEHLRNAHIREGLESVGEFLTVGPDMRR